MAIDIMILDKKETGPCAGCAFNWGSPDNILLAQSQIKSRFNREADIRYYDLSGEVPRGIEVHKDRMLPALVINGQVRISGQFDLRMLLEAVGTHIEINGLGGER